MSIGGVCVYCGGVACVVLRSCIECLIVYLDECVSERFACEMFTEDVEMASSQK